MFDTALLESRRSSGGRARAASLPVAIGLHVVVVGAFVGAAVWSTGEPPEPVAQVVFFPSSSPRPPAGDPSSGPHAPTHATQTTPRQTVVMPPVMPDAPSASPQSAPQDANPLPLADDDGGFGGGSGSPGPGVLDGTGAGDGGGPGGAGGPDEILRPGGAVSIPVLVERVDPEYPELARRARLEGVVILEAVITASGRVEDVRLLKSVHPVLDAEAERAVRLWRYRPATLNGRAVNVYLTVTVTFGLKS